VLEGVAHGIRCHGALRPTSDKFLGRGLATALGHIGTMWRRLLTRVLEIAPMS